MSAKGSVVVGQKKQTRGHKDVVVYEENVGFSFPPQDVFFFSGIARTKMLQELLIRVENFVLRAFWR